MGWGRKSRDSSSAVAAAVGDDHPPATTATTIATATATSGSSLSLARGDPRASPSPSRKSATNRRKGPRRAAAAVVSADKAQLDIESLVDLYLKVATLVEPYLRTVAVARYILHWENPQLTKAAFAACMFISIAPDLFPFYLSLAILLVMGYFYGHKGGSKFPLLPAKDVLAAEALYFTFPSLYFKEIQSRRKSAFFHHILIVLHRYLKKGRQLLQRIKSLLEWHDPEASKRLAYAIAGSGIVMSLLPRSLVWMLITSFAFTLHTKQSLHYRKYLPYLPPLKLSLALEVAEKPEKRDLANAVLAQLDRDAPITMSSRGQAHQKAAQQRRVGHQQNNESFEELRVEAVDDGYLVSHQADGPQGSEKGDRMGAPRGSSRDSHRRDGAVVVVSEDASSAVSSDASLKTQHQHSADAPEASHSRTWLSPEGLSKSSRAPDGDTHSANAVREGLRKRSSTHTAARSSTNEAGHHNARRQHDSLGAADTGEFETRSMSRLEPHHLTQSQPYTRSRSIRSMYPGEQPFGDRDRSPSTRGRGSGHYTSQSTHAKGQRGADGYHDDDDEDDDGDDDEDDTEEGEWDSGKGVFSADGKRDAQQSAAQRSTTCSQCNKPFGLLRSRHCCMLCGVSVCTRCSTKVDKTEIGASKTGGTTRICLKCERTRLHRK